MPINRITVFDAYGRPRQKKRKAAKRRAKTPIQKLFGTCAVTCREEAPGRGEYGSCLRSCLRGKKPSRKRAR